MGYIKKSVTADVESGGGGFSGFIARMFASGLYVGYVPAAQGTFGSLWGPLLFIVMPQGTEPYLWLSVPFILIAGVWASYRCESFWGVDPGRIVIDEVAGVMLTFIFLRPTLAGLAVGFFLFRFFDIVKIPPARQAENLHGGWGVMLDDIIAGVYAHIVLRVLMYVFPGVL